MSISSDVFQERLDAVNKTVEGATGIADDLLAKGDSEVSHDLAVFSLLGTAQSNNLKFNTDKIQFKMKECKFFGQLLTMEEMSINLRINIAIRQMGASKCKKEQESFQGMVN